MKNKIGSKRSMYKIDERYPRNKQKMVIRVKYHRRSEKKK